MTVISPSARVVERNRGGPQESGGNIQASGKRPEGVRRAASALLAQRAPKGVRRGSAGAQQGVSRGLAGGQQGVSRGSAGGQQG
eukprot:477702-Prorocentrum_minimum.AAC.1